MSKTGDWLIELQEDAHELTQDKFIKKHGFGNQVMQIYYQEQILKIQIQRERGGEYHDKHNR